MILPRPLDRSVGGAECARMKEKTVNRSRSTTHLVEYLLLQERDDVKQSKNGAPSPL